MSRRLVVISTVVAVLGAACTRPPQAQVHVGSGRQFVPLIADSLDDVGLAPSVAVTKDGVPYFSYFGFPAVVAKGEIPTARSVYAPTVPGVLLASVDRNLWQRGAAAVAAPTSVSPAPPNVNVPFGPQTLPNLSSAEFKATNVNGTDVVVDSTGGIHVVWTGPDGVWYAGSTAGANGIYMTAEQVFKESVAAAGPIGWPSVAVDDSGNPYVAFTNDGGAGRQVQLATKHGSSWKLEQVATAAPCAGCPQPARTQVTWTAGGPLVVYADNAAHAVVAVTQQGRKWVTQTVESNVAGTGLSIAQTKDGSVLVSYYAGNGQVHLATLSGGAWTVANVGASGTGARDAAGSQTTGVAVDGAGTIFLTWVDGDTRSVMLASSSDGKSFTPIATSLTIGGQDPTVGVAPDGSAAYVAWFDPKQQDLDVGLYGNANTIQLANPSPIPQGVVSPERPNICPPTSATKFQISAQNIAFNTNCLAVNPNTKFSVVFANNDSFVHDFAIYTANPGSNPSPKALVGAYLAPVTPGSTQTYPSPGLPAGTYFFRCDYHPLQMTGTFQVGVPK